MPKGTGVSAGVGLAQARLWHVPVTYDYIPRKCAYPAKEVDRFEAARRALHGKTRDLRVKTARIVGDGEAAIFDAYSMILDDEEGLLEPLRKKIRNENYSAEFAVTTQFGELAREFLLLENEYMRQRVDDVFSIRDQLMRELMGQLTPETFYLDRPAIIVAQMLSPADIANLDVSRVEGIVCEAGGYSSHTSIIARTLGIPAIMAVDGVTSTIKNGDLIAVDGESGEIWVEPDEVDIELLRGRAERNAQRNQAAQNFRGLPTISSDGHRVELAASIGHVDEMNAVTKSDAESLGLFRTELLHMGYSGYPSEEEQYAVYCKLLAQMGGKTVTIRTFDDGSNPGLYATRNKKEEFNPVLGYRGIRMSLGRPSFFRTQLRALLRASAFGKMRIMFPMISILDELDDALNALEHIKNELRREKIAFDENIPVGMYMAVPSAALQTEMFAEKLDFITVGINDLIQFTMAIDRSNPDLVGLYHMYHPAGFRILNHIVQGTHAMNIPCYLNGEAPGFEKVLPALMGLGLDGFAVSPSIILRCRQILNRSRFDECKELAEEVLQMRRSDDLIKKLAGTHITL
ncbi:phosphoenolpyruvate--protein phosphotransferase [Clostridia bacterium OttesenSCG-928-O13]|nr:phosphoenolpyruvate--protein phosphotransferase [Clostridia bacterium OttesenSCG-928-O13]